MRWEHPIDVTAEAWDEIAARLDQRPATWLQPFLLLAAPDARPLQRPGRRPWVRLGEPGLPATAFLWRPYGPEELFERFVGELGLRRDGERIWIWIDGEPEGGTGERNGRAIDTLLLLLAAALSVVTPSDSG